MESSAALLEELRKEAAQLGKCPCKRDVPPELVVQLKARFGPWPRVLEAAGLKPTGRNS